MTKSSSLRKRMSENAVPLTEGAQSQNASVSYAHRVALPPLIGQLYLLNILEFGPWIEGQEW